MNQSMKLTAARVAKNDEFYTQLPDIEVELSHYRDYFRRKTIYCCCDDKRTSQFYRYFTDRFDELGILTLITTCIGHNGSCAQGTIRTPVSYDNLSVPDGDIRGEYCAQLFDAVDTVVTNPPFSVLNELLVKLVSVKKDFLVIGNINVSTNRDIFPLFRNNQIWFGHTVPKSLLLPCGNITQLGNTVWITNIDTPRRHEPLHLTSLYTKDRYPFFYNIDAINVNRLEDIPNDYDGMMGVPITYLQHHCPDQFVIVGGSTQATAGDLVIREIGEEWCNRYFDEGNKGHVVPRMKIPVLLIDGKTKMVYKRVFIQRRK